MDREHEHLFARAQDGDRSVLPVLLAAHADALVGFLRLHSTPRLRLLESAADLAQSTCREVLEGLDRFEFRDPASFRAWIFQRALMVLQRRQRYHSAQKRDAARAIELSAAEERALLDTYSGVLTPSRHAAAREELQRFELAFDQLPADYQQVISLTRIAQLPHAQVAAVMERSEQAVRNLLSRALARLAEVMIGRGGTT